MQRNVQPRLCRARGDREQLSFLIGKFGYFTLFLKDVFVYSDCDHCSCFLFCRSYQHFEQT
jgi:hypothetical protein